jgi:hypothetical protein
MYTTEQDHCPPFVLDPGGPARVLMKTTVAPIDLPKEAILPKAKVSL